MFSLHIVNLQSTFYIFPHLAQKIASELCNFLAENKAGLVRWHFSVEEHKSMTPVSGCVLSESDHKNDLE